MLGWVSDREEMRGILDSTPDDCPTSTGTWDLLTMLVMPVGDLAGCDAVPLSPPSPPAAVAPCIGRCSMGVRGSGATDVLPTCLNEKGVITVGFGSGWEGVVWVGVGGRDSAGRRLDRGTWMPGSRLEAGDKENAVTGEEGCL